MKDIEALFSAVSRWATDHPIIGFAAMGWLGGIIAVLRVYEKAGMALSLGAFMVRCVMKGLIGLFVAVMAFFAWGAMGWSLDWGYLVAGICGLGGSDIIEAVVLLFIEWLRQKAGNFSKQGPPAIRADEAERN